MNLTAALHACRAVLFDWDGTLADTHERNYRALVDALAPYEVTVEPGWYRRHCGLPVRDLLAVVPGTDRLPTEQILATSRARLLGLTVSGTLTAVPATVALARRARAAGLPCAVASGAAAALVTTGLDVLGLTPLFQAVVTRDDVEHGKPAPDTFIEAARRLAVAAEDCLVVEDAQDGVIAARAAAMRVLLVRDGQLMWQPDEIGAPEQLENLT
jgi:beta-phosphoglucomutase-like phosphatase (HAD superfamily)